MPTILAIARFPNELPLTMAAHFFYTIASRLIRHYYTSRKEKTPFYLAE